ncbi:hypothetical protein Ae201684_000202 [Aphanomyces euteiches]|uniref:Serine/threonine-protein phosphatase n=1 Tax=Aphanomyces euteiches TaxID=100861 RepID=A0A6G0XYT4_9STRA|nr:hypothetical protein Ae201684_000202 [Aphanomyces euteiches]
MILRAHPIDDDLRHWQLWCQLDCHDEAKMLKLSIFMQSLLDNISLEPAARDADMAVQGDIDLDNVRLHDVIHLEFPLDARQIETMTHAFKASADEIRIPLPKTAILKLIQSCTDYYSNQPNVIFLQIPRECTLTVVGDLHGQLQDLLYIFKTQGPPSPTNWYLFNGDMVDRGDCSIEICAILMAYQSLFPQAVHINRGNHEDPMLNRLYTFHREVLIKYDHEVDAAFNRWFTRLPLCYVVNHDVFVVHGAVSLMLETLIHRTINSIPRHEFCLHVRGSDSHSREMHWMQDLLWSDPRATLGHLPSHRGAGVLFGPDVSAQFLRTNDMKLIIRSHEAMKEGFLWPYDATMPMKGQKKSPHKCLSQYFHAQTIATAIIREPTYICRKTKATVSPPAFRSIEEHNRHNILQVIVAQKPKLREAFLKLDSGQTGKVTVQEWASAMKEVLELDLEWSRLASLFAHVENNLISYGDFLETYRTIYQEEKNHSVVFDALYSKRKEVEVIFCFFDTDNSGTISMEEFQRGCQLLNTHLPEEEQWNETDELFRLLSLSGSNSININEFFEAFRLLDNHHVSQPKIPVMTYPIF